jgi:small subunit ribosomal protein S6
MKKYEVMFVLDPALDDDKKAAAVEAVKAVIAGSGEVTEVNEWGLRKLAYPILKKTEGYYVVMQFDAEPELPRELDRRLRINDNFLRHIIVSKDEE